MATATQHPSIPVVPCPDEEESPALFAASVEDEVFRDEDDDTVDEDQIVDAYDDDDDEDVDGNTLNAAAAACCAPLIALRQPVEVGELGAYGYAGEKAFWAWPLLGPLLFENTSSDVRDGLANERTFLSYLRLSVTMAVVAVAIVLSFHLKHQPTPLELRMALPLGILFWLLSLLTLAVGIANYIKTINKYSRRMALVQSGWKTQSVMAVVALCILGACVTLLVVNRLSEDGS